MSSSTQRALSDRAVRAAALIEFWGGQIGNEMKAQNIDWINPGDTKLTLPANMVAAMLSHMIPLAREIRQFQKNLANKGK
jgi:hypothetical protein